MVAKAGRGAVASASGDSVAVMRVGRSVCQARWEAAAWRCSGGVALDEL